MPRGNLSAEMPEAIQMHLSAVYTEVYGGTNFAKDESRKHFHFVF